MVSKYLSFDVKTLTFWRQNTVLFGVKIFNFCLQYTCILASKCLHFGIWQLLKGNARISTFSAFPLKTTPAFRCYHSLNLWFLQKHPPPQKKNHLFCIEWFKVLPATLIKFKSLLWKCDMSLSTAHTHKHTLVQGNLSSFGSIISEPAPVITHIGR
jgi:hypothetical protein